MRYELIVERKLNYSDNSPELIYLDTFDSESVSLNYNIADINDLSNKNSSYSKTIKLPNTGRNRSALSNIFNLESSLEYFPQNYFYNPNEKIKAYILQDGLNIFEGNLQLTNINYDYNNNIHSYDVIIYSENDGLFKRIGEGYLSDLDLNRYNHKYNYSNIVGSWTDSYQTGYYYPMIDYGTPLSMGRTFTIKDFKVGVYARIILDQIFAEAGYSYQSDFINSDYFSKLILLPLPSNSPGFTNLITTANKEGLIVGQNGSENYRWDRDVPANNVGNFWDPALALYSFNTIEVDTIIFDPNGLYSTASQIYNSPTSQRLAQKIKIDFGLIETGVFYDSWNGLPNFPAGTTPKWTYPNAQGPNPDPDTADFHLRNISDDIRIYVKREYINNGGGATSSNFTTPTPTYQNILGNNGYFSQGSQNVWSNIKFNGQEWYSIRYDKNFKVGYDPITNLWQYSGSITTDLIFDPYTLVEGEKIRIFVVRPLIAKNGPGLPSYYGTATGTLNEFKLNVSDVKISVVWDDTRQVENGSVNIPRQLSNIKQKDYLTSIIRMFNLYLEPSKTTLNTFLIEPRDDYYQKYGTLRDWSKKIDLDKPIQNEIASNIQNRTQYFSHKADKDFYNDLYTQTTNTIFGEYNFEFDNEFTSGQNKIETIFSPTPNNLLSGSRAMVIPSILALNNGNFSNYSGGNPRILYATPLGLTGGDTYNFWPTAFNVGTPITQTIYPYAGFSNDPFNPNKSLNFGDIKSFVTGYNETQNNLYYTYWSNTITDLNSVDSRFLTAYFYLNANDINQFTFADLIYISVDNMAGYYRVNKILDYDPNQYESVKVELVKALTYVTDLPLENGNCPVLLQNCLCGPDIENYMNSINAYYDSITPYLSFNLNGTIYTKSLSEMGSNPLSINSVVDWVNDCCPPSIPGLVATYFPGTSTCSLNFEVEMGEEAANVFVGSLNNLWDNSPENGGSGPDPYVVIYVNYPCGSTYGTWQEYDNTYFWDLSGYNDQYTFLDWWIANIPGGYGTASGEILAEGAYLKLGWNYETSCLTASSVNEVYFTMNLDSTQTAALVNSVNNSYGTICSYLVFWNTYAYASWPYTIPSSSVTITDIVDWANTNVFGMSASTNDGNTTFYWRQDGVLCDTCNKSYVFKLSLSDDNGSPANVYVCNDLFISDVQQNPCVVDCFGNSLQLYVAESSVNYLPGGWTPDLFVTEAILGPTSGPVYDAGGLTYGVNQDLCLCTPESVCFTYETTLPCPGGVASMTNYISTAIGEEVIFPLWETFDDCQCDSPPTLGLRAYQNQSQGFRGTPVQTQIYSGVINTSIQNTIQSPNNIVSGNNNFVYNSSNIISGDNNGFILGRGNIVIGDENYGVFGSRNFLLGASISTLDGTDNPSVLVGNNIVNEYEGSFVFGNNVTLTLPVSPTGSTADSPYIQDVFVVGNNISLTGSIPNNTTYLGTENIIISENGGFNPTFIISDAVSTTQVYSGQIIKKTSFGYVEIGSQQEWSTDIFTGDAFHLGAGLPPTIYSFTPMGPWDGKDPCIISLEVNWRGYDIFPSTATEFGDYKSFGSFVYTGGAFSSFGTTNTITSNNTAGFDAVFDFYTDGTSIWVSFLGGISIDYSISYDVTITYQYQ
jgi:hypothetical protein